MYFSGNNIGTVQGIFQDDIIYLGTSFAPGIWAGTEDMFIKVGNRWFIVVEVLFDRKSLKLNTTKGISLFETISSIGPFNIVDSR